MTKTYHLTGYKEHSYNCLKSHVYKVICPFGRTEKKIKMGKKYNKIIKSMINNINLIIWRDLWQYTLWRNENLQTAPGQCFSFVFIIYWIEFSKFRTQSLLAMVFDRSICLKYPWDMLCGKKKHSTNAHAPPLWSWA